MRIDIDCEQGELASRPEQAIDALVALAVRDGADEFDWLEKALRHGGATELSVKVKQEPRYQIAVDVTHKAIGVYDVLMARMRGAILERLQQAARSAEVDHYRRLAEVKE